MTNIYAHPQEIHDGDSLVTGFHHTSDCQVSDGSEMTLCSTVIQERTATVDKENDTQLIVFVDSVYEGEDSDYNLRCDGCNAEMSFHGDNPNVSYK